MGETILKSNLLPEPLFRMVRTDMVKIREAAGEIRVIPISENFIEDRATAEKQAADGAENRMRRLFALCGSGADLELTVDSFLAMTHDEAENMNE